jgi:diguanylate cyclase (GGDEF)-like protein/putative nucleotidyltransferase with HDIG domain
MIPRVLKELLSRFEASRLSTKVLLLSALVTVPALLILTGGLNQAYSGVIRNEALTQLKKGATSQASEMDAQLDTWRNMAMAVAADPRLAAQLNAGASGAALSGATRAALGRALAAETAFKAASLVDHQGHIVLSTDSAADPSQSLSRAPYFQPALDGHVTISDLYVGQVVPAPTIFVAAPVSDGIRVFGALVIRTDPSRLLAFYNPSRLNQDEVGMLIDSNGVVVGYNGPEPDRVLYHIVSDPGEARLAALRRSGQYGSQQLAPLEMGNFDAQITGSGASGGTRAIFPVTGRSSELGYNHLSTKPWTVVVLLDELTVLAPLNGSTFSIFAFLLLTLMVIFGVIFVVMRILERTETESLHDDLTDLPNRRFLHDILVREVSRSQRTHRPLSVINIDLDHFKAINDVHGHHHGDEVLRRFGRVLSAQVRSIDLAARYGGEEFMVLLPDTDKEGGQMVAEKVRRAAAELDIAPHSSKDPVGASRLSLSAGVASFPEDAEDEETLLRHADQAMYLAKSLGRNQVIAFGSPVPLSSLSENPEKINLLVRNANRATVEALAAAIDARDAYTSGHSRRVADYSMLIGRELSMPAADLETLHLGALLHDLGKIGVSDRVLRKSGKLNQAEMERVQTHAQIGYEMVQGVDFLRKIAPIILSHHENLDGTGYPQGLKGDEIPLVARIVKVADAFDAMTSARTYRVAGTAEWALGELRRNAGKQFDLECVEALQAAHNKRRVAAIIPRPAVIEEATVVVES